MTQWRGPKAVIRDVIIVWIFTFIGGWFIGLTAGQGGFAGLESLMSIIALSNLILGTIAFCISGCMMQEDRWKHLAIVATFAWLTSIANVIAGWVTLGQWMLSIVWMFVMAGAGGGLSFLINKPNQNINRTCPHCAEEVKAAAIVCKHCGRDLPEEDPLGAGV